jgi:ACS family hexuronate transporter-like MFS transporter
LCQIAGAVAPTVMGLLIAYSNGAFLPAFLFLIGSGVLSFAIALTWHPDEASRNLLALQTA